jgi:hypothetical protein
MRAAPSSKAVAQGIARRETRIGENIMIIADEYMRFLREVNRGV